MHEQLITFECAVLAKQKQFTEPCYAIWVDYPNMYADMYSTEKLIELKLDKPDLSYNSKEVQIHENEKRNDYVGGDSQEYYVRTIQFENLLQVNNYTYPHWYAAPTQSLLQKWLREVHKINIQAIILDYFKEELGKYVFKLNNTSGKILNSHSPYYETYEQALEAGLIEALKLIK